MQRKLLTPPRLAAAAALALGGLIAGPSVAPANAGDCVTVTVWYHENSQGREYVLNDACVGPPTLWGTSMWPQGGAGGDTWLLPPGTPTGAGYKIGLPVP